MLRVGKRKTSKMRAMELWWSYPIRYRIYGLNMWTVCVCNEIETKLRSNDWSSIKKRADGCQVTRHERETTTTKCAVYFISFYGSLFSGWHTFSAKDFLFVTKELALFCFDYLFIELVWEKETNNNSTYLGLHFGFVVSRQTRAKWKYKNLLGNTSSVIGTSISDHARTLKNVFFSILFDGSWLFSFRFEGLLSY